MQKEPPLSPEERFIGAAQCKLGAIWERSQKADVTAKDIADDVAALLAWMRPVVPR